MLSILAVFVARCFLVALFLPFSALDKILNFGSAVDQANQTITNGIAARLLIVAGFCVEVLMSLAILTGVADRLAAFILALYCMTTALLWKRFWTVPGFRLRGRGVNRDVFWDFLKNFALAGGFFLLAFGDQAGGATRFLAAPLVSSHPYSDSAP